MPLHNYIKDINKRYVTGIAREHTYRPSLQSLIETVIPRVLAANDPARIKCGAPDFILLRGNIPVGYIEAKDIGNDLDKTEKDEQIKRYLGLDNLLLTDYLEFRFYQNGEKVEQIHIAEVTPSGQIKPLPDHFDKLVTLLVDFAAFSGQTITAAKNLAEIMARKARLMRDVFYKVVQDTSKQNSLHDQFKAFKTVLVHGMDEKQFADVYAQTVAYGLFTARLHDKTLEDFSRQEALLLIPKSNPFLRQLFHYIAGPDLDDRVVWIVDALCKVYRATDLRAILKDLGAATGQNDPILHFYETFLGEYDKKLKKARGVWYTPEPVVNFIVRAIDDVLKNHFGLKEGLADTSKVKIQVEAQETDKRTKSRRKMFEREVHKVQLLDVAAGTGTFLAEAVKQIYRRLKGQEGLWSSYVERDLLPRLHGFELLIASYAICHMKLDLLLQETGYKPSNPQNPPRLGVYLTNSLEEHHPDMDTLFAKWLSREANEASYIKKETPIMVAFGNPPYSGESVNKGDWILKIMEDYKQEPSGGKLREKNSKWLNDDYVKFIRLGEYYIDKNGEGILAYITNHGYLDNPTFRGMRWRLLNTFDDIYILDLHGNSRKKEVAPDGKPDKNVFDIQQGVAIIVGVKHQLNTSQKPLARVHHADLWGDRYKKYDFLNDNTLSGTNFTKLKPMGENYFFIPKDHKLMGEYEKGFAVNELFPINSVGIVTARDALTIHEKREDLVNAIERFSALPVEEARQEYNLSKDVQDWKVSWAQDDLKKTGLNPENIQPINYRPFDTRWTYYTGRSRGFHCRPRGDVMRHFLAGENLGLVLCRQTVSNEWTHAFCTNNTTDDSYVSNKSRERGYTIPLFVYENDFGVKVKTPNLNLIIYELIKKTVSNATPENLFDYIYAVLHSPEYRQRYAEFLKSDFPRIPYPKDTKTFHAISKYGTQLRELHLMESNRLNDLTTTYPVDGDHEVTKPSYKDGKVWINHKQYFGNVQEVAWEFYIGGYQPAQKWLKDRKGRKLTIDDIRHWQRMIVALTETDRIMQRIDAIDFLPKGKK